MPLKKTYPLSHRLHETTEFSIRRCDVQRSRNWDWNNRGVYSASHTHVLAAVTSHRDRFFECAAPL